MGLNPSFVYPPIVTPTGIRAFHITPRSVDDDGENVGDGDSDNDMIQCSLAALDLDKCTPLPLGDVEAPPDRVPGYVALSYVWGSMDDPATILLDGRPFRIGRSLHTALRHMRRLLFRGGLTGQLLWVDSICINQEDLEERVVQVRMMDSIYKKADFVIVELGLAPFHAANIPEFLDFMSRVQERRLEERIKNRQALAPAANTGEVGEISQMGEAEEAATVQAQLADEPEDALFQSTFSLEDLGMEPPPDDVARAGYAILSVPYYSRAWIRQEFILPVVVMVMLGDICIEVGDLYRIIIFLMAWKNDLRFAEDEAAAAAAATAAGGSVFLSGASMATLLSMRYHDSSTVMPAGATTLLNRLSWSRASVASDARDKIYSFLGLASDRELYLPHVTYDLSMEEVYYKFARLFIENGQAVEMLYQLSSRETALDRSLPSWVPDWSSDSLEPSFADIWEESFHFAASGSKPAAASLERDDTWLCVQGIIFDTIVSLTHPAAQSERLDHLCLDAFVAAGFTLARSHLQGEYVTGESPAEVVYRTAVRGPPYKKLLGNDDTVRQAFLALARRVQKETATPLLADGDLALHDSDPADSVDPVDESPVRDGLAIFGGAQERSFCVTERGYLGMCPGCARPGDRVAVLLGGPIPFVLRPQCHGEETVYTVVGNGYFHGLMNGEVFELSGVGEEKIVLV